MYVGIGGWAFYKQGEIASRDQLRLYSRHFNFVEVNATFYRPFEPKILERWRRQVPPDFVFSVKCYQKLTHVIGLRPYQEAFNIFGEMLQYCKILNAKILLLQLPPYATLDDNFVRHARDFFASLNLGKVRIACEFRVKPINLPTNLINLMQGLNLIHVVDISYENPCFASDMLYTRVFGLPKKRNMLDQTDIESIASKIEQDNYADAHIVSHGRTLVRDAERIKERLRLTSPILGYQGS